MRYFLSFGILLAYLYMLHAHPTVAPKYPVSDIPAELLKGVNAVVRIDRTTIDVQNISRSTEQALYVVTILNKKAEKYATKVVHYNKAFSKSVSIQGNLYDAHGKLIRKLKQKDIIDASAVSSGSLYTSSRMLVASLAHTQYPYTVEFSYTKPLKDLILPSGWYAQNGEKQAVEIAQLTIHIPNEQELLYKNIHIQEEPEIIKSSKMTSYNWFLKNLKPLRKEPYGLSFSNMVPMVLLTLAEFKWDQYVGSSKTWEDYGKFHYELNKDRDELPPEVEAKVLELCEGLTEPIDKIKVLYEYMQENTRYVSVQLGIGGWQTYDVAYVYKNGYGDCKALSNYMQSMLKRVGITSHTANIYAGSKGFTFQADFPSNQFNHRILCVPMEQDTLWLECTSSDKPIGYLGDFAGDRYALLLTPNGGKLVRTPSHPAEANRQTRKARIRLLENGNASVDVHITYTGYQQDDISQMISTFSPKDQEKWLRSSIDAGSFQLKEFAFTPDKTAAIPTYFNTYSLEAIQWAGVSGSRIFLKPNVLERRRGVPPQMASRTQEIELHYPYLDTDTINYEIPLGFRVESMPDMPIKIEEVFGTYEANITFQDNNRLIYTRKLRVAKMRLPAEKYQDYRNFFREVVKADKLQVVLSKRS